MLSIKKIMLGVAGIGLAGCAVFIQRASRIPSLIAIITSFRKCEAVEIAQAAQHALSLRCVAVLARTTAQSQCHFRLLHCGVQCPRTWHLTRGHVTCIVDSILRAQVFIGKMFRF
jgi:hypothetical protein